MKHPIVLYSEGTRIMSGHSEVIKETKLELSRAARSMFGISNNISNQIIDELTEFIRNHYSEFTPKEIRYAFELYAAGKLDVSDKFWGSMSAMLLSAILNAYREHKKDIMRIYNAANSKVDSSKMLPEAAPETKDESMYNKLVETAISIGEVPFAWDWESAHRHLMGIMADVKPYLEYKETAQKILSSEASNRRERNAFDKFIFNDVDIMGLCKKLAVQDYIKNNILKNGTNNNNTERQTNQI
jgi:hypothetical protein